MNKPCSCGGIALHPYIDRHGDIEMLCAECYALAVYPKESPELARRDRRVAWLLAAISVVVILFGVYGCATFEPTVNRVLINNQVVTEYTDTADAPKLCGGEHSWLGCYDRARNRIDYRSPVSRDTVEHERGHAAGMHHGPFYRGFDNSQCATVYSAGGKYHAGDTICITRRGESIIPAPTFAEAK